MINERHKLFYMPKGIIQCIAFEYMNEKLVIEKVCRRHYHLIVDCLDSHMKSINVMLN